MSWATSNSSPAVAVIWWASSATRGLTPVIRVYFGSMPLKSSPALRSAPAVGSVRSAVSTYVLGLRVWVL